MFFKRIYRLEGVPTVEDLADKLLNQNWCLCTAFYIAGHGDTLFLNDSTSLEGIQEYAAVRQIAGAWYQVESITFGWITDPERAAVLIATAICGGVASTGTGTAVAHAINVSAPMWPCSSSRETPCSVTTFRSLATPSSSRSLSPRAAWRAARLSH